MRDESAAMDELVARTGGGDIEFTLAWSAAGPWRTGAAATRRVLKNVPLARHTETKPQ